ncbi:DUF262 domain-containing protein [Tenacibaculum piscium]|uniref:DUF262 domain-containing protein n=1 Tax=Tenacibaculum piscium TaxID=1458515 RepID=UPI001EFA3789|nr:DUF262 domain-containing protein [Tenacibaculum piscium]MCG8182404.1 DUF262 domain-containing protein [Tenacibaculum piscium]MCG8203796.1 DUF262 domain-containing protein [Tenacibaculum piscium]
MENHNNKIEASDKNINDLLKDKKFFIDYFQREYRWQEKHMLTLIEDLSTAFLKSYKKEHKRSEVANYQSYYLGPVVFSIAEGKNSIIDGQQRITSITLFLIYLNHLQKKQGQQINIENLIFSEKYGEKSFNMTDQDRQDVLKGLFENESYQLKENDDETIENILHRYHDIHNAFSEELTKEALPYFIDWFIGNVILVKITAYSDENAYTIFETMNDRGMNLTATEMLKGYVLSRINKSEKRSEINELWKKNIKKLHEFDANADLDFFKAWFRAKYAITVRPRKVASENQDYEQIATRLHDWFKNNHQDKFELSSSSDFYKFFKNEFDYMIKAYQFIWQKTITYDASCPHLFYINYWGIAGSLKDAMLLAPLKSTDDNQTMIKKIDLVSQFIENYTVRRAINYKKFGASSIQYTFFNIIKSIRNLDLEDLNKILSNEINHLDQTFEGVINFRLHQQNKKFVKHLLCRITAFVDKSVGKDTTYENYQNPKGKKFEIEHLWSNHFEKHKDEFDQEWEFVETRNSIGALILLPNGTNQSFNSDNYQDKLPHYLKENTYAQTLHPDFYEKNPNYKNSNLKDINFKAHNTLKKLAIKERTEIVKELCEVIWSTNFCNKK